MLGPIGKWRSERWRKEKRFEQTLFRMMVAWGEPPPYRKFCVYRGYILNEWFAQSRWCQ